MPKKDVLQILARNLDTENQAHEGEVLDTKNLRIVFERLEQEGVLQEVAREIISEIISKTNFFDDIQSLGLNINEKTRRNRLLSLLRRDDFFRPVFTGQRVKYKKEGTSRYHGVLSGEKVTIYDKPFQHSELLWFLLTSNTGSFPKALEVLVHEVTHLVHLKTTKKLANIRSLSLANTTVNEALARRFADIPIHLGLSSEEIEKYIEAFLLPQSSEDYRYLNADAEDRDQKIQEWKQCFLLIDALAAEGMSVSEIATWLAQEKLNYLQQKKSGDVTMSELDYFAQRLEQQFAREDRQELLLKLYEKRLTDFQEAQSLAKSYFERKD